MGFFSWETSDTKESIPNSYSDRDVFTVYLLSPDGEHIREDAYEGYGKFGGTDVFVYWMRHNRPDEIAGMSEDAIRSMFFNQYFECTEGGRIDCEFPIKFSRTAVEYASVPAALTCPYQGYFYEN